MSSQLCSRCLTRASLAQYYPTISFSSLSLVKRQFQHASVAPFSTSSILAANPPRKVVSTVPKKRSVRGEKTTFTRRSKGKGKTLPPEKGKRPAPGERKALRNRVVLSNTNALEVKDLKDLSEDDMTDPELVRQVVGIPGPLVDQLRAVQAFKPNQGWSLFRRPAMLMREETVAYGRLMQELADSKQGVRRVLVGERGSGKSVMLLQVMAMAMIKGWVVISIPDAMDITIANTAYNPLDSSTPTQYIQPDYIASLLLSIQRANPILQTLKLSEISPQPAQSQPQSSTEPNQQQPPLPTPRIPIPPNIPLSTLCQLGADSPPSAHAIFARLLHELKQPGRPPLLLTLDGLSFAMRTTKYTQATPPYNPIHAHDLSIISTFLAHLSGSDSATLPNGGLVLAAVSESNRPRVEALDLALGQIERAQEQEQEQRALESGDDAAAAATTTATAPSAVRRDPYKTYDSRVMDTFSLSGKDKGIEVQRMTGLSRDDARVLMEYWAKSGIVRGVVGERQVGEMWAVSGGGVVGELERACVRRGV